MPERWLDAEKAELRAEICPVQSTREETVLLFGMQLGGTRAKLERRIILSPAIAKQLATGFADVMREYESRLNATPAGGIDSGAQDSDAPVEARPMLALVRGLRVGFGFEKSFKMSPGNRHANRVILGVRTTCESGIGTDGVPRTRNARSLSDPVRGTVARGQHRGLRLRRGRVQEKRHSQGLRFQERYRYPILSRDIVAPLVYPYARRFTATGAWGWLTDGSIDRIAKLRDLDREFMELAARRPDYRRYVQWEMASETDVYERCFGPEIYGRFLRLKAKLDAKWLLNRGSAFAVPEGARIEPLATPSTPP